MPLEPIIAQTGLVFFTNGVFSIVTPRATIKQIRITNLCADRRNEVSAVYWTTETTSTNAMRLYNSLATRIRFIKYQRWYFL